MPTPDLRTREPYLKVRVDPQTGLTVKTCRDCQQEKSVAEFPVHDRMPDGRPLYGRRCKPCTILHKHERYERNSDHFKAKARRYRAEHLETSRARSRSYHSSHRELLITYGREYRDQNRERLRAHDRARSSTPKRKELDRTKMAKRRAIIVQAAVEVDRQAIIERDKSQCYICGKRLCVGEITLDHVVPFSRGGEHTPKNVKVACKPCNDRKGSKLLIELDWVCLLP